MNSAFWELGISGALTFAALTFAFKFGDWRGRMNSDLDDFRQLQNEIRSDIKEILIRLPQKPTASKSPIHLTELGERISGSADAKQWAEETANQLIQQTTDMNSIELQSFAFEHAKTFAPDESLLQHMQESAFQEGTGLDEVRDALGVELRDSLLRRNDLSRRSLDKQLEANLKFI